MRTLLLTPAVLVLAVGVWIACATSPRFSQVSEARACEAARSGEGAFAGADLDRGEALFETECQQCHSLSNDHTRPSGPHLHGVLSRRVGGVADFRYSQAFEERSDVWTLDALDRYLEDPNWSYPGTRMRFAGLQDPDDRRDLVAYLTCATD